MDWSRRITRLPGEIGSLANRSLDAPLGTLFVLGTNSGMGVSPDSDFSLVFGRCEPDVHICVGAEDVHVSRRQGHFAREKSHWVLSNIGRRPIRLPTMQRLLIGGNRMELPAGYTPLFIVGPRQEHLLEVRIVDHTPGRHPATRHEQTTRESRVWPLRPVERLVLVCLAQHYLRGDPRPQPLTWEQVASELADRQPGEQWTRRRAAHIVAAVRKRLSTTVRGITEDEAPAPVAHMINHNLIMELLVTTTLVHADLKLLAT
ncbi:hypothetical protein [Parafrankia sp. FMc2]|uniref:hypothetical protein n=1 Tax=Parafrankia sp. FMc2 TaxID=3233196 RepID=UPI0034D71164